MAKFDVMDENALVSLSQEIWKGYEEEVLSWLPSAGEFEVIDGSPTLGDPDELGFHVTWTGDDAPECEELVRAAVAGFADKVRSAVAGPRRGGHLSITQVGGLRASAVVDLDGNAHLRGRMVLRIRAADAPAVT